MESRFRLFSLILVVAAATGCGGAARGVRPTAPTYAEATGATCTPGAASTPFIVDLPPDQRGEVESAMKHETVIVAYDCKQLKVLNDCTIGGEYSYEGLTAREQVISINDEDEMRANLPFRGSFLAAELGVDFGRSRTLDIALAIVGKRNGAKRDVLRSELEGKCAGATHFIRSAQVGAFAMQAGAQGQARAVADLFGVGASGNTSSTGQTLNRDGSLEACRAASSSSKDEKSGCAAPLRVELDPLLAGPVPASAVVTHDNDDEIATACPDGMRSDDAGKCVRPSPVAPYVCSPHDPNECATQCERRSMGSCAILGRSYQIGRGVKKDLEKAVTLLTTACQGGATPACGRLGEMLLASPEHRQQGLELLSKSCERGWFQACTIAANHYKSAGSAKVDVFDLFRRGCAGGDAEGCWSLGQLFKQGLGVPQNDAESTRYFRLACDGGAKLGCSDYASALAQGKGVARDPANAVTILERACDRGYSSSCSALAMLYFTGKGVRTDAAKGVSLLERACEGNDTAQCVTLAMRYQLGQGVARDLDRAARYYNRGCEAGLELACKQAETLRASK